MHYTYILAIDPSGSFNEGKGTTGLCVYNCKDKKFSQLGILQAKNYETMEAYWHAHLRVIDTYNTEKRAKHRLKFIVVIEDYIVYANKAVSHTNSRMETSKLIGIIQHHCARQKIPYHMQLASEVKTRWTDEILEYKGLLKKSKGKWEVCEHTRDSMRHAIHYASFRNEG